MTRYSYEKTPQKEKRVRWIVFIWILIFLGIVLGGLGAIYAAQGIIIVGVALQGAIRSAINSFSGNPEFADQFAIFASILGLAGIGTATIVIIRAIIDGDL